MGLPPLERNRKSAVKIILGRMSDGTESGGSGYGRVEGGEEDYMKRETGTAKKAAVQRLMTSIEHRDIEGIQLALETFMGLCDGDGE